MRPLASARWYLLLALLLPLAAGAAEVEVDIRGVDGELLENVHGYLGIWQYRDEEGLTDLSVRRLHARASDEIRAALLPFGYYAADVDAQLLAPAAGDDEWQASYDITPGIPVTISSIDIDIAGPEPLREALLAAASRSPVQPGARLHHGRYGQLKDSLLSRALGRGYLDAAYTVQELRVDRAGYSASIHLRLAAGRKYLFGPVEFRQDLMDEDFLSRYVEFDVGEPFNYQQMLGLRYALSDSDYFVDVDVRPDRDNIDEQEVPVIVEAKRNKRHRYSFGLGFGTDTGARATAGWQNRYVNRRGHQAAAEIRAAEISREAGISYTIPLKQPRTDRFVLTASWEDEQLGDERAIKRSIGANIIRMLGPWQRTAFLRYEDETDDTTIGAQQTTLVLPGVSFLKTSSDQPLFPSHGYKLFYELRGASETLGSDAGFVQFRFQTKRIYSPLERLRLLLRLEAGGTEVNETSELPVSQRFFAGGDRSVRGFDYNRLGPRDADGNVVGGRYLLTGSAELEYRFADNWGVASFVDAGNAADRFDMPVEIGAGIGLRWRSPVGMVRFDLAAPVNSEYEPPHGVEIHISIGPDL